MKYIISLSGGNNSLNCLDYCIKKFGKENVIAIFADTNMEHKSLYEGLDWMEKHFNINIIKIKNEYNPWTINEKHHQIWANKVICTQVLKINPIKKYIFEDFKTQEYKVVLGYNKSEQNRINKAMKNASYPLYFPCLEEDFKGLNYKDWHFLYNFPIQHVYEKGGRSNNCGGACMKMSLQAWYKLWKNDLEAFLKAEENEQWVNQKINDYRSKPNKRRDAIPIRNDLWLMKKQSLKQYRIEWEQGIVPKFNKLKTEGQCSVSESGCGFNLN